MHANKGNETFLARKLECEHTVPFQEGGGNQAHSWQLLCRPCHVTRTGDEAFRGSVHPHTEPICTCGVQSLRGESQTSSDRLPGASASARSVVVVVAADWMVGRQVVVAGGMCRRRSGGGGGGGGRRGSTRSRACRCVGRGGGGVRHHCSVQYVKYPGWEGGDVAQTAELAWQGRWVGPRRRRSGSCGGS